MSLISSEAIRSSGLGTPGQTLSTKCSPVCPGEQRTAFLKSHLVSLSVQVTYFLLAFFPTGVKTGMLFPRHSMDFQMSRPNKSNII